MGVGVACDAIVAGMVGKLGSRRVEDGDFFTTSVVDTTSEVWNGADVCNGVETVGSDDGCEDAGSSMEAWDARGVVRARDGEGPDCGMNVPNGVENGVENGWADVEVPSSPTEDALRKSRRGPGATDAESVVVGAEDS